MSLAMFSLKNFTGVQGAGYVDEPFPNIMYNYCYFSMPAYIAGLYLVYRARPFLALVLYKRKEGSSSID